MGENGAGRSTLTKALTGVQPINGGTIELDGRPVSFSTPGAAQRAGISTVNQEVNLLPNLSVAENVMLGREPRGRFRGIDWRTAHERTRELLATMRLD
ncbi:ATP-binding cassette domain-containing protein, partial [Pseudomonas viridiflava]|uniref:ATP-binding cassette domain-containing protein n=1 Tax=Pseudomonas viridiflava TaxID=33069 RepID=UPI001F12EE0E